MKPLLLAALVGAALMVAATLVYVRRPREYAMANRRPASPQLAGEGVQPFDPYPCWMAPGHGQGWVIPDGGHVTLATNAPAWERGEVGWQRSRATGLE